MIPNHFNVNLTKYPTLRLAGIVLALLAAVLFGGAYLWAQGDTPIVIGDGSLTIESRGVAWATFTGTGNSRRHPHTGKAVTSVAITMPGNNQTVAFTGQKCTVTVRYLSTVITVVTGNNGRGLQVQTNFNSFHAGSTPNHLAHNDASGKISHVTVMKGNQTAFDSNATGGTEVVISYQ